MRTTVTLDSDVERLLRDAMRERGTSFKQTLNSAIRDGLRGPASRRKTAYKPMVFNMGRPLVDLTRALSLADDLGDRQAALRHRAP